MILEKDLAAKKNIYDYDVPLSSFNMLSFSLDKIREIPELYLVYVEREKEKKEEKTYFVLGSNSQPTPDLVEDTLDAYLCLPSDLPKIYTEQLKNAEPNLQIDQLDKEKFKSAIADTLEIHRYSLIGQKDNKFIYKDLEINIINENVIDAVYLIIDVNKKTLSAELFAYVYDYFSTDILNKEDYENTKKELDEFLSGIVPLNKQISLSKEKKDQLVSVRLTKSDYDTLVKLSQKYNCNRNTMIAFLIRNYADKE